MSRKKRSLSCYHRNQTLLALQVESLIEMARLGEAMLQQEAQVSPDLETLLRSAGGELGRLYGGAYSTYRADSARRILEDAGWVETVNQIRKDYVAPKGKPKPLHAKPPSSAQPVSTWRETFIDKWARGFRIYILEHSDIVRLWALVLVIAIALAGGIALSRKWAAHQLAAVINEQFETAVAGTKSPTPSTPPYSWRIKMMTPEEGLPGATKAPPAHPATATPTPTPVRVGFSDGKEDTFDRSNQAAYLDPQADILGLEVHRFQEVFEIWVLMASPFPIDDYSYAIILSLRDAQGVTRMFSYEVHDGVPNIGEIDSNYNPILDSPVVVGYDLNSGQMTVQFPTSYLDDLTPPFTLLAESYHMRAPDSPWTGDETEVFGPFDFPGPSLLPAEAYTSTPFPISVEDPKHDALDCKSGEAASSDLPESIDLTGASAKSIAEGEDCFYVFGIELAQPVSQSGEFWGGVEFYDPQGPMVSPPDPTWHFNNTGNYSFNFHWEGTSLEVMDALVQNGAWQGTTTPGYSATVEGNKIILKIPCDVIPQEATWFVTTTAGDFSVCEQAGLGEDGLPSLRLPMTAYTGP